MADLYGRKPIMLIGAITMFLAYSTIMLTHSYVVLIVSLFVCGMMSTVRIPIFILYMFENMPSASIGASMTVFFCLEAVSILFASIYFMFIS